MPAQTTSLSAVYTTDSALAIPLLLQPAVGELVDPLSGNRPNQSSRSLLFVDGGVADYQMLLAGVSSGTEMHLLDSSQDAVTQITNTLLGRNGISSLHIVSHGEAGGLDFGTGKLNLSDLPDYAAQLQSWGKALTDDADILLYGCNVAQGELGQAFTSILSQLTGADVAASDDLTGSAALGGDWMLEYQTGSIEAGLAFSESVRESYTHILPSFTAASPVAVGSNPRSVAIGDFNGDGKADIVAANDGSNTVSVSLGDGLGGFSGTTTVAVGSKPLSVAIGDLNGDGKADIVAANFSSNTVSVLLNAAPSATLVITDAPVNIAPVVTVSGTPLAYTENDPARLIDSTATVADSDSANFDTGTLTVNFSANGTVDDRLAINNQGTSTGQIGVSGSNVTYEGTTISTFTGGVGATPLVVTFNSNSSPAAAQALLRNLAYSNVSDAPSTVDRTVSLVLTDGDGGTSATANKTITVAAVNDAPTVTAPAAIAVSEDTTTTLTGISFADVDAGNSIITATLTVGAGTLGATTGGGVTVSGTATDRTLSGTIAAINTFITGNNLTYTANLNDTTAQTLGISINDNGSTGTGGGLTSAVTNVALNVAAVNDAPTMTAPAAIAVIEDTVTALTGIAFADVDATNSVVIATLAVGTGTLAATSGGGVTVGGTATSRTLSGTITAINSFIAANNLTYNPVLDSVATQTLSVSINDNGNTGTGGSLSSSVTSISLNVTAVNDAPSFTKGGNQTITAGAGVQTLTNWATGFNPGAADEASQTVQAYVVTVDNAAIFAVPPTIDTAGNLIYTPATKLATATTATISVSVRDSGGTANVGNDTSAVQTFTITVKPQPTISIASVSQSEGDSGTDCLHLHRQPERHQHSGSARRLCHSRRHRNAVRQ
jgi:hypothetical protein